MELAFVNPQLFTTVGIIAIVVVTATIMLVRRSRKPRKFTRRTEALLGILVLASGALASNVTYNIQEGIMNGARIASFQEAYGISLTSSDLADLRLPRGAPPAPEDGELMPFGVTQVVHEGKVLTLFGAWNGETFDFYDGDGNPLPTSPN